MSEYPSHLSRMASPQRPEASIHALLQSALAMQVAQRRTPEAARPLSPREREVAVLMAGGCTNREIANALFISIATAERHASNIFNKLGVRSRTRVAVWAIESGLTLEQAG